ncbi:tetratricopeptide repeat protein [Cryomorphaceae bacterium]|nr:tetratricopeptide repeat protein [Cryomorphaceae bacterium]
MRKTGPIILISVGVVLTVLLYLAPRTALNETTPEVTQTSSVDELIDEAIEKVRGDAPMEGIMSLRQIAEEHPNNPKAQFYLGLFSIQSGQYEKAVERFRKVVELDPNNVDAYRFLGDSHRSLGDTLETRAAYGAYLELSTDEEAKAEVQALLDQWSN